MNRQVFLFSVCVLALVFSLNVEAKTRACGAGYIKYSKDCSNSNRDWHITCCEKNARAIGVAYNDLEGQDYADAVGVICRDIKYGNEITQADYSKRAKRFECDKTEIMAGIIHADVRSEGKSRDELDAVTAMCENPKYPGRFRKIENSDLYNAKYPREETVSLSEGRRIVGLAYKERQKGTTDRADCVAVVVCDEQDYRNGRCH
jgi:hypothetical protein